MTLVNDLNDLWSDLDSVVAELDDLSLKRGIAMRRRSDAIRALLAQGVTLRVVAEHLGTTKQYVWQLSRQA